VGEGDLAAVIAGPDGLTERSNTFDEPAVLREFAAAATQALASKPCAPSANGSPVAATFLRRAWDAHERGPRRARRALIDLATSRAGGGVAQLDEPTVAAALAAGDRALNAGQIDAVRAVATSGNGVDVIEALAGTGKTYTAGAIADLYQRAGYTVIGVAPSGRLCVS